MELQDFRYYFSKKDSYAQHGEDMLLKSYFERKTDGFFVDVGAHHPFRFSNSYFFYKRGWRGINIDAKPGSKKLFDFFRSRDINLEMGIAQQEGALTYYMFNEPALNGFSKDLSESRNSETYKIIGSQKIPVQRLEKVLEMYLPANTTIDFMTVDVEGLDLEVLASNNWERYRPQMVVTEELHLNFEKLTESVVYRFMKSVNYELVGKTYTSLIFQTCK